MYLGVSPHSVQIWIQRDIRKIWLLLGIGSFQPFEAFVNFAKVEKEACNFFRLHSSVAAYRLDGQNDSLARTTGFRGHT